jgi:hypothetical protein
MLLPVSRDKAEAAVRVLDKITVQGVILPLLNGIVKIAESRDA